jgi:hypothetical protein
MAVGAYTSSVLSLILFTENKFTDAALLPPWTSLILFPVVIVMDDVFAALAGLIVAIPSFKTRDNYLAINHHRGELHRYDRHRWFNGTCWPWYLRAVIFSATLR